MTRSLELDQGIESEKNPSCRSIDFDGEETMNNSIENCLNETFHVLHDGLNWAGRPHTMLIKTEIR